MATAKKIVTAHTWATLNEALKNATEEECWALLENEKKTARRAQFMMRIHSRANKLRAARERLELVGGK